MSITREESAPPPYPARTAHYDAATFTRLESPLRDVEFWLRQLLLEHGGAITLNAHGVPGRRLHRADGEISRFLQVSASDRGYQLTGGAYSDADGARHFCFRDFATWSTVPEDSILRDTLATAWQQVGDLTRDDLSLNA